MKYVPLFASVIALIWASAMVLRAERLPWLVPAYVLGQCLFALVSFFGLQRNQFLNTRGYLYFFGVTFSLLLVLAASFAIWLTKLYLEGPFLCMFGGMFFLTVAVFIYRQIGAQISPALSMSVCQGGVLTFAGSVALISLALPLTPELRIATFSLGAFWFALGVLAFCWSLGVTRNTQVWLTLNQYLPAFLAIVAFSYMAFELGKLQSEAAREALPMMQAAERLVAQ